MMKCPSCGFEEDKAKYCKQCGAPMVTDKKAEYIGVPQYTGITISPPTASQGLKVEDLEESDLHDDPQMQGNPELGTVGGGENSFGIFLIMAIVVALVLFGIMIFRKTTGG